METVSVVREPATVKAPGQGRWKRRSKRGGKQVGAAGTSWNNAAGFKQSGRKFPQDLNDPARSLGGRHLGFWSSAVWSGPIARLPAETFENSEIGTGSIRAGRFSELC
jgi:hypothetical protein